MCVLATHTHATHIAMIEWPIGQEEQRPPRFVFAAMANDSHIYYALPDRYDDTGQNTEQERRTGTTT